MRIYIVVVLSHAHAHYISTLNDNDTDISDRKMTTLTKLFLRAPQTHPLSFMFPPHCESRRGQVCETHGAICQGLKRFN